MVKLIRLKSDQDKLLFNNNIQSDLIIKPNSKIALQNVSFKKSVEEIVVDSTNKKIIYNNGNSDVSVNLTESIYDNTDFQNLITDMNNKLNLSLNSTNSVDIGTSFNINLNSFNKMNIKTTYGTQINPTNKFTAVSVDKSDPTAIFKNALTSAWDAYLGSDSLPAFNGKNGCGIFRAQIGFLDTTGFGVYIGLSETRPSDMGGDVSPNKCQFVINAENSASVYRFVDPANTTLASSTLTPENVAQVDPTNDNDILAIEASEGKIELKIYNASNPAGIILPGTTPQAYNGDKPLYPIVGFYSNTLHIKDLSYTPQSNLLSSTEIDIKQLQPVSTTLTPPQQDSSVILKEFDFQTTAFAKSLGFDIRVNAEVSSTMNFLADNSIRFFDDTECYLVEALNLNFDSYDGAKGQEKRRNLLAVIQNIRDRNQPDVLYDSNSLTFINLNNPQPLPLRNLQLRIINSDEGDVDVVGFSNMTLLLED